MRIENGIAYFDLLPERIMIVGLAGGVGAFLLTITFATIFGIFWWLSGWSLQTSFWMVVRVGMSIAILSLAVSFVGIVWQLPTVPR